MVLSLIHRKFWRDCLPRLKYHNPAVSMTVNRTQNQEGPALMSVHYTTQSPAATTDPTISTTASKQTPPVAGSELGSAMTQIKTINMKHRSESEILDELMKLTEARAVKATVEDMRQIRELEEQNRQSELEAVKSAELNAEKKRQKAILDQARGEMGLS
jgi:large subunit ribosomal protein MRP49